MISLKFIAGFLLFIHDLKDVGKTERPHHWQLGALLMLSDLFKIPEETLTPEPVSRYTGAKGGRRKGGRRR